MNNRNRKNLNNIYIQKKINQQNQTKIYIYKNMIKRRKRIKRIKRIERRKRRDNGSREKEVKKSNCSITQYKGFYSLVQLRQN